MEYEEIRMLRTGSFRQDAHAHGRETIGANHPPPNCGSISTQQPTPMESKFFTCLCSGTPEVMRNSYISSIFSRSSSFVASIRQLVCRTILSNPPEKSKQKQ